jgi:dephospho-CoA kinase
MNATPRIPVIGLTGAIGAGKSAVAAALRDLGAVVHDADKEVSKLLDAPEIIARIGRDVAPEAVRAGALDRRALASAVFDDAERRARLEAILHPPVIRAAERLIANPPAGARAVVLDAPLLLEAGMDRLCDAVWFVNAPREARLARVRERGWDEAELDRRAAAQMSLVDKRARASLVIENDGSLEQLRSAVERALMALPA